jgi:hypothetical protein
LGQGGCWGERVKSWGKKGVDLVLGVWVWVWASQLGVRPRGLGLAVRGQLRFRLA